MLESTSRSGLQVGLSAPVQDSTSASLSRPFRFEASKAAADFERWTDDCRGSDGSTTSTTTTRTFRRCSSQFDSRFERLELVNLLSRHIFDRWRNPPSVWIQCFDAVPQMSKVISFLMPMVINIKYFDSVCNLVLEPLDFVPDLGFSCWFSSWGFLDLS